ncbi:MAG TPA: hypothetical protein DCZ03_15575 [Gammaproteobacteria bacterium]|nr:hypothetical protein [Gammaproteobacteria bacterium]
MTISIDAKPHLLPVGRPSFLKQMEKINTEVDAVLAIRLTNFDRIQDLLGYEAAQDILYFMQEIIKRTAPQSQSRVARVAESTFALPLTQLQNEGHAKLAAMKFIRLAEEPFVWHDHNILAKFAVGISKVKNKSGDASEKLRQAELGLSTAVVSKEKFAVYTDIVSDQITRYWQLEDQLHRAIEMDEMELHYQPKIDIQHDRVYGAEALIRWHSSKFGQVFPDEFISIAEESGQIADMSRWVLKTAFRDAENWSRFQQGVSVAINISASVLKDPDFLYYVESAAAIWGMPLERCTIEITESELMCNPESTIAILEKLKEKNIRISIDDFGTGYSSLAYLKDIPADEIKIDKSFVLGMAEDLGKREIVRTIIALSHSLGYKVVAEGVEDLTTLEILHLQGCDIVQGYYFAKALPKKFFYPWLEDWKSLDKWIELHS